MTQAPNWGAPPGGVMPASAPPATSGESACWPSYATTWTRNGATWPSYATAWQPATGQRATGSHDHSQCRAAPRDISRQRRQ